MKINGRRWREIGIFSPWAKEYLGLPETGRGTQQCSPRGFDGSMALPTPWFKTSGLQNGEKICLCQAIQFLALCHGIPGKLTHWPTTRQSPHDWEVCYMQNKHYSSTYLESSCFFFFFVFLPNLVLYYIIVYKIKWIEWSTGRLITKGKKPHWWIRESKLQKLEETYMSVRVERVIWSHNSEVSGELAFSCWLNLRFQLNKG